MGKAFDRRVVPEPVLDIIRRCQCHLTGGAALSGVHLAHRLSRDIDLACHRREDVRTLATALPELVRESCLLQDGGAFVRADLGIGTSLDITFEGGIDLEPSTIVDGIHVESLVDLRASKLTCIVSRSAPRDLVDLLFLDRARYPLKTTFRLRSGKIRESIPAASRGCSRSSRSNRYPRCYSRFQVRNCEPIETI